MDWDTTASEGSDEWPGTAAEALAAGESQFGSLFAAFNGGMISTSDDDGTVATAVTLGLAVMVIHKYSEMHHLYGDERGDQLENGEANPGGFGYFTLEDRDKNVNNSKGEGVDEDDDDDDLDTGNTSKYHDDGCPPWVYC